MRELSELVGNGTERREIPERKTPILIAGLPGKMATLVAEAIVNSEEFALPNFCFSSDKYPYLGVLVGGKNTVYRIPPKQHQEIFDLYPYLRDSGLIAVDFTTPQAVNQNAEIYAKNGIPFVMGTTGGDRKKLIETVRNSEISAVIAPNMAPHLVLFQAMLDNAAQNFPGALEGYRLKIVESHQSTKKDPSGTGRAWQGLLENLGVGLTQDMESIRDPKRQQELGIRCLDGHGYHWLTIKNPDGTASIEITTKVEGRKPYVEGTLMALEFLKEKVEAGSRGEAFSMIDVLRAQTKR